MINQYGAIFSSKSSQESEELKLLPRNVNNNELFLCFRELVAVRAFVQRSKGKLKRVSKCGVCDALQQQCVPCRTT
jgi:hypothetical protein